MRNHLLSGGLGLLLAAACGAPLATSNTGSSSACVGATIQNCVGFSADFIDGQTLMDRSGIQYQANTISSGKVVCQVDFEPKKLSQCFPANEPYWALFVESGGRWTSAPGGFSDVQLHDNDTLGWHYVAALDPQPAPPPPARKP
jgi:hypothetical protein